MSQKKVRGQSDIRLSSHTTLRKIGNSRGVLLTKEIVETLNISEGQLINISVNADRSIVLTPSRKSINKRPKLNLNVSTWEQQFKKAIDSGQAPENDIFNGVENKFDKEEWK